MRNVFSEGLAALLRPFVEIRSSERLKTILMFFFFFLTITTIYILKPIRSSLFLNELGAENLRFVYMGEGVFLIFVVAAYVQFAKMVPTKTVLYTGVLAFFISNLVIFWFLFHLKVRYLSAFFYIWVASFSITLTTQFWTLANDLFSTQEAKRLFGLIASGGSAGGILGGILTNQAVKWVKTEDLLLVAAAILGICIYLVSILVAKIPQIENVAVNPATEYKVSNHPASQDSAGKIFRGSSYLVMLVSIVAISKIASTIVDNQFNGVVEQAITGKEARTAFFGGFMAWLNVISLLAQLFLTSFALRYLGVGYSLAILPSVLSVASFSSFISPILFTAVMLKVFDGSLNYSVQHTSKEVLYLPIPSAVRYRVKPLIDMLGFRAAKSLAGVYIAVLAPIFGLQDQNLGILVLALLPIWGILIWRIKKGYSRLLREQLLNSTSFSQAVSGKKKMSLDAVPNFLNDGKSIEEIKTFVSDPSPVFRKFATMTCLIYRETGEDFETARRFVDQMGLNEGLEKMREKIGTNRGLIKKEIGIKAIVYEKIQKIRCTYKHHLKKENKNGYLNHLLKALGEENLERIFQYLEWLYPNESIPAIYERVVKDNAEKESLRNQAAELLSNTVEPDLIIPVQRVLEERDYRPLREAALVRTLKRFAQSEDPWYAITSLLLFSELKLYERWPELAEIRNYLKFQQAVMKA